MLPAYLFRVGIDWVRHQKEFSSSNPYARCEQSIKVLEKLFEENLCRADSKHLEVAAVCAYWEEFFHLEDPLHDEKEWEEEENSFWCRTQSMPTRNRYAGSI